jgi:ketopantoate reductase
MVFRRPVVIVGIGELGSVFARGLLRRGHPVFPVVRGMSLVEQTARVENPELVLVAVAEHDLEALLAELPSEWRTRAALLQNELVPAIWQPTVDDPTVAVVWFEKKPGMDVKVLLPTPIYGAAADTLVEALGSIGIPARALTDERELTHELVRKNLYILTTNIAGMRTGGTVGELWRQHRELATRVAGEVLDIQQALTGQELPRERLMAGLVEAFEADPDHKCTGRSAPARLSRALDHARQAGIEAPVLTEIAENAGR